VANASLPLSVFHACTQGCSSRVENASTAMSRAKLVLILTSAPLVSMECILMVECANHVERVARPAVAQPSAQHASLKKECISIKGLAKSVAKAVLTVH
jgi:hypothetical protein